MHKIIILFFVLFMWCAPVSAEGQKTFHGVSCTKDCSGHRAGYQWAEKKKIQSVDECRGSSKSFVEGCRIYVEEHQVPKTSQ